MSATPISPQHPLTRMWVGPHSILENMVMGKFSCPYQESNHDYLNNLAQSLQWLSYHRSLFYIKQMYLYMPCRHTQQHRCTSTHLTSALDGGKRSASLLSSSTPRREAPGNYCIRGLVGGNITCFSWFLNLCRISQQHSTTFPRYNIEKIHLLYTGWA